MTKKTWITLYDGGSDEWLYARRGAHARAFLFVSVLDMHAATGDTHGDRYASEVKLVDLATLSEKTIADAQRSCGWDLSDMADRPGFDHDLALAEMCQSYGAAAPVFSNGGSNRRALEREARREANDLATDDNALEDALDRPVNAIGSTAREYAAGDFASAMQRGCEAGNPNARLMAKMHAVPQPVIDDTRPDDWLPYAMGYMAATSGSERESNADIAPEYQRGYDRGVRVKAGEAPAPSWIKQGVSDV
jgi:hypothetical protein